MPSCQISIATEHASKYLQQLCKHFAHKVDVEYNPQNGFAALPPGPCNMKADDKVLHIHCVANEAEKLPLSQSIIEIHLKKFAWREELTFNWEDCPDTYAHTGEQNA